MPRIPFFAILCTIGTLAMMPVGILYRAWVETLASMDLVLECYLHPLDYPVASLATAAIALAALATICRGRFAAP